MQRAIAVSLACLTALVASGTTARGQEKETPAAPVPESSAPTAKAPQSVPNRVLRIIQIKYQDPRRIKQLLSAYDAVVLATDGINVLTVAGSPQGVDEVEAAIRKLDAPRPPAQNIQLTAYVLMLNRQAGEPGEVPVELNEVVGELRKILSYKGFHLLNTELVTGRDGGSAYVAETGGASGPLAGQFSLSLHRLELIPGDKVSTVHIDGLAFTILPFNAKLSEREDRLQSPHIDTSIDIPVGQKVVVGKTALDSPDNAIVLVLTARVLD